MGASLGTDVVSVSGYRSGPAGPPEATNRFGCRQTCSGFHSSGRTWQAFSFGIHAWEAPAFDLLSRVLVTLLHRRIARVRATRKRVRPLQYAPRRHQRRRSGARSPRVEHCCQPPVHDPERPWRPRDSILRPPSSRLGAGWRRHRLGHNGARRSRWARALAARQPNTPRSSHATRDPCPNPTNTGSAETACEDQTFWKLKTVKLDSLTRCSVLRRGGKAGRLGASRITPKEKPGPAIRVRR